MGNTLYVGHLNFQTTSEDMAELFGGAGAVKSAQVIIDRDTQQSKGFAFIEMGSEVEALRAISLYNGHVLQQRTLVVNEARPRGERTDGRNSGRSARPGAQPRFREIKHKVRGGRKARPF